MRVRRYSIGDIFESYEIKQKKYKDEPSAVIVFAPASPDVKANVSIFALEVLLPGGWKDMEQAFKDRDIIPSQCGLFFGEPKDAEQRERGWFQVR